MHVGIVGAGQLGRMLALAGYPIGVRCLFLDRSGDTPGAQVAPSLIGDLEDAAQLAELARRSDVVTFDWENICGSALKPLEKITQVRPPRAALEVSQDRLAEKALFARLKIPVAEHAPIDSREQLVQAARAIGLPGVLKTRRLGYDGKGQFVLRAMADIDRSWAALGGTHLIYEKFQNFSREVSLLAVRSTSGQTVFYPLSANTHGGGILRYSIAPFANTKLEGTARLYSKRVMTALDYVGVLAIEFFVVGRRLVANEMAPRVHNSGHWTIEGCVTSQFENHLRAVCGMPLGSTRALGATAMINFLGLMPPRDRLLAVDGLAYHDYGKMPRPGRKLGHCTILKRLPKERDTALASTLKLVEWA
ncbi:MAG TPA: 5-(carboxyamino)imidazole ribonucleotide synthase [Steroidobacteraceae bacterium]|jgi:5-(carboxyamino)imidazole ribonucleotide synthase|nr:5-(carboxyamino)imidazole ribonucleotide synthase [Steroidobacteraceae bacterium]